MPIAAGLAAVGKVIGPALAAGGLNLLGGRWAARRQRRENLELAKFQADQNKQLLREQLEYNAPINQMARFKEAGLNPNMVIGQGSPGNQAAPLSFPDVKPADYTYGQSLGSTMIDALIKGQQYELIKTQSDLNRVKADESVINQDLKVAQTNLVKANPYMRQEYVDMMVKQLTAVARQKQAESRWYTDLSEEPLMRQKVNPATGKVEAMEEWRQNAYTKLEYDLVEKMKRIGLLDADQKVKAQIIEGKEWQNILSELEVKWLRDGEIKSDNIYQGIFKILSLLMMRSK